MIRPPPKSSLFPYPTLYRSASLTRTATITFSEAMNTGVAPTVSNNAGTTLTSPTNGHWADTTHYTVDYTAADANTTLDQITTPLNASHDTTSNTHSSVNKVSSGT